MRSASLSERFAIGAPPKGSHRGRYSWRLNCLAIKKKNQLIAGKRKTQVRTDGPFAIYAVIDDTLGNPDLLGYVIEGPGSYSSWLLSTEQVEPELEELKAKLGR